MRQPIAKVLRGRTLAIIAGGPSALETGYQSLFDEGIPIITINDAWRLIPLNYWMFGIVRQYFCDVSWWNRCLQTNPRSLDGMYSFHDAIYKGRWITGSHDSQFSDHPQVAQLLITGESGLEKSNLGLRHGSNSGHQALNVAYHLGAKRIILIGYDMKVRGDKTHWFGSGQQNAESFSTIINTSFLPHFPKIAQELRAEGVAVLNACINSEISSFMRVRTVRRALQLCDPTKHKYEEGFEGDVGCAFCLGDEEEHAMI